MYVYVYVELAMGTQIINLENLSWALPNSNFQG
jgi:hypothetical protein